MKSIFASVCLLSTAITHAGGDPRLNGLRDRWLSAMKELDIPGAAVVVVRGDQVVLLETLGVRNVETNQPVTPDTMFYIASCTKSFMAMAVMTLVEQGKIDLDAPVKKYLPQFQVADPELTEKLTIRDLLSHAKGLDSGEITFGEAYSGQMTEERYWRLMKQASARGEFRYTNLHYTILGRVVEKVSGQKWQDYVEQHVCRAAGMNRTTAYASRMYGDADVAIPTILWDGKLIAAPQRKTDRTMHAAGGMGSTAQDLGRWMILNLNGGQIDAKRVLSEASISEMQKRQAERDQGRTPVPGLFDHGYGLGWETGTFHDKRFIRHGGGYVGTAALVLMFPQEKLGVAVLVNTDASGGVFTPLAMLDVMCPLLPAEPHDLLPEASRRHERVRQQRADQAASATRPVNEAGLSLPPGAYAGAYENDAMGTLQLELRDGRLTMHIGDMRPQIFTTREDRFVVVFAGGTFDSGRFEVADGKVRAVILSRGDDQTRFERK
jgi:CubicO group peptidase (beta-lactamase class C family)